MAYKSISVDVDIDLDEVIGGMDSDDLVEEIIDRLLNNRIDDRDIKLLKSKLVGATAEANKSVTLVDVMKQELWEEQFDKYTLCELQNLLNR